MGFYRLYLGIADGMSIARVVMASIGMACRLIAYIVMLYTIIADTAMS